MDARLDNKVIYVSTTETFSSEGLKKDKINFVLFIVYAYLISEREGQN